MTQQNEKIAICMKWGTRYCADYVNRLWRAVQRNVSGKLHLICFTDDISGIIPEVDCRPLPNFEGVCDELAYTPWRKLSLWKKDLGDDLSGKDALFLDLDLVITGNLDDFWNFMPGKYVVWENPTKSGRDIGNTSVFRFCVGRHPEIYNLFMADPIRLYTKGFRIEQEFISSVLGDGRAAKEGFNIQWGQNEQAFWPKGWCRSFKEDILPSWPLRWFKMPRLPENTRIVVFHGKPDPDEALIGRWPAKGWKRIYKYVRPTSWIADYWN